jgi:hypothetical protein
MGISSTTLSFRGTSQETLEAAYRSKFPERPALIAPARNGWVTVFDAACDYGQEIETTAPVLCRECDAPCFAFVLVSSSGLFYWVYDQSGNLVDRSFPINPQEPKQEEIFGLAGDPERIADVFGDGLTGAQIRTILEKGKPFLQQVMWKVAELLGIEYMGWTYHDLVHPFPPDKADELPKDWDDFVFIGRDAK